MRSTILLLITAALLLTPAPARAEYVSPDLELVPIGRLITNLEAQLAAERAETAGTVHALARAHAMAYAWALADDTAVQVDKRSGSLYLGRGGPRVPWAELKTPADQAARDVAARHLTRAVELYERAVRLLPGNFVIRLGHAWCLIQAGRRDQAKERLRAIVAAAFEEEEGSGSGALEGYVTVEAARYLLPLLDPETDANEIEDVREKVATIEAQPRAVTPLVLPRRDGLDLRDLIDPRACVRFDLDGTGRKLEWQWITREGGWLVFDPRGSGRIDSALQLFGERTFGLFLDDAYAALSLLDDDRDGWLRGAELTGLAVWHDADQDGVSEPGEVLPLAAWGVTGLSCRSELHPDGIRWNPAGLELAGGRTRPSFDVVLAPR